MSSKKWGSKKTLSVEKISPKIKNSNLYFLSLVCTITTSNADVAKESYGSRGYLCHISNSKFLSCGPSYQFHIMLMLTIYWTLKVRSREKEIMFDS